MTEYENTQGVEPLTRGGVEEVRRHPASRCELALVATIDALRIDLAASEAECARLRAAREDERELADELGVRLTSAEAALAAAREELAALRGDPGRDAAEDRGARSIIEMLIADEAADEFANIHYRKMLARWLAARKGE